MKPWYFFLSFYSLSIINFMNLINLYWVKRKEISERRSGDNIFYGSGNLSTLEQYFSWGTNLWWRFYQSKLQWKVDRPRILYLLPDMDFNGRTWHSPGNLSYLMARYCWWSVEVKCRHHSRQIPYLVHYNTQKKKRKKGRYIVDVWFPE